MWYKSYAKTWIGLESNCLLDAPRQHKNKIKQTCFSLLSVMDSYSNLPNNLYFLNYYSLSYEIRYKTIAWERLNFTFQCNRIKTIAWERWNFTFWCNLIIKYWSENYGNYFLMQSDIKKNRLLRTMKLCNGKRKALQWDTKQLQSDIKIAWEWCKFTSQELPENDENSVSDAIGYKQ